MEHIHAKLYNPDEFEEEEQQGVDEDGETDNDYLLAKDMIFFHYVWYNNQLESFTLEGSSLTNY